MAINTDGDIVYVFGKSKVYHQTPTCHIGSGDAKERRREVMEAWDNRRPCEYCHDEFENPATKGGGHRETFIGELNREVDWSDRGGDADA